MNNDFDEQQPSESGSNVLSSHPIHTAFFLVQQQQQQSGEASAGHGSVGG